MAEGTIFRVFPDKESLIEAVVDSVCDTTTVDAALAAIDPDLPLEDRLVAAVDILRRRFADILQVRTAVEMMHTTSGSGSHWDRHPSPDLGSLAALFGPDADQIRHDPLTAAYLLRGMTVTGTHPALILDEPLSSAEIVSLFLDGVRLPDAAPPRGAAHDRRSPSDGKTDADHDSCGSSCAATDARCSPWWGSRSSRPWRR